MSSPRRLLAFVPDSLLVEGHEIQPDRLVVHARAHTADGVCPMCGRRSQSVHSRYHRTLHDVPSHGRVVVIRVTMRRFRCRASGCSRSIFAERLPEVAEAYGRRTCRMDLVAHYLGLALGGRPAARMATRLSIPLSADSFLRIIRRRAKIADDPLRVVGIDDWAWRRGQRYGTVLCDLERRRIIDLLPDLEPVTVEKWLADHPDIEIIARDRSGGYSKAATAGASKAIQVADRWHLMAHASAAFLEAVRRSMRKIRDAIGVAEIDPTLLTSAERRQFEGGKRREATNAAILALAKAGVSIKEIVRRTGHSRGTVRRVVRGGQTDMFRTRESSLDPYKNKLEEEWQNGCHVGAELWRRLRAAGFNGSLRVVTEWVTRKRRDEAAIPSGRPRKLPSARVIAKMMTTERDHLSADDALLIVTIEKAAPDLLTARDLIDQFHAMIRKGDADQLDDWIKAAKTGLLESLANGIIADRKAVHAALNEPWSNGQTEGQITKLKLVKRQMYGRAKLNLLRARVMDAA